MTRKSVSVEMYFTYDDEDLSDEDVEAVIHRAVVKNTVMNSGEVRAAVSENGRPPWSNRPPNAGKPDNPGGGKPDNPGGGPP